MKFQPSLCLYRKAKPQELLFDLALVGFLLNPESLVLARILLQ